MNLLPGLHEALRLMALNDLDFAPGTIMKRIEQLEGERVKTELVNFPQEIMKYQSQMLDLKSTVAQRDEAIAACAVMRQAVSDFVHNVERSHVSGWGDVSKNTVADNSFKEVKASLSPTIGITFLERMRSLEVALGGCVECLRLVDSEATAPLGVSVAMKKATTLLNERSK